MKICLVGAELFHADRWTDRQTDMTKIKNAFRNFANTSKMLIFQKNSSLCVSHPYLCTWLRIVCDKSTAIHFTFIT